MKKMYTYVVAALLIVACSLWFYHANAKVCFLANEGDCGQNASGNDLDPYENETDIKDKCCHRTVNCSSAVPGFNAASPLGGVIGGISKVGPGLTSVINPGHTGVINPGLTGIINPGLTGTKPGSGSGTIEPSHSTLSWFDTYPCKYRDDAECENVATASNPVIGDFCPYSSQYALTCPLKYQYDSACVSPLVSDGRCGKKYACKCGSKYQFYMEDGKCKSDNASLSDTAYSQDKTYIAGEMCSYITGEDSSVVAKTLYSRCECPATLYPYKTAEDCVLATGGEVGKVDLYSGNDGEFVCNSAETDNNGNVTISPSYARCRCNREHYVKDATTCSFIPSKHCKDDTGTYVVSCCYDNPNLCKYTKSDEGKNGIKSVDKCDCFEGYKIVGCADGYKYVDGACAKSGCKQALENFFDVNHEDSYAIYGSEKYKVSDYDKVIVADSIVVNDLNAFANKEEVMSAQQYIMSKGYHDPEKYMTFDSAQQNALAVVREYCATLLPTITENEAGNVYKANKVGTTIENKTFNFKAVKLDLKGKFDEYTGFKCTNCQIVANGVTFGGYTLLDVDFNETRNYNTPVYIGNYNITVTGQELNITGQFKSSNYVYNGRGKDNLLTINIENDNEYSSSKYSTSGVPVGFASDYGIYKGNANPLPVIFEASNDKIEKYRRIEFTDFILKGSAEVKDMFIKDSNVRLKTRTFARMNSPHDDGTGNEYCRNILTLSGSAAIQENWSFMDGVIEMCAGSAIGAPSIKDRDTEWFEDGGHVLSVGGQSYIKIDNSDAGKGLSGIVYKLDIPKYSAMESSCEKSQGGPGTSDLVNMDAYLHEYCHWQSEFSNHNTCVLANYAYGGAYENTVLSDKGMLLSETNNFIDYKYGYYHDSDRMQVCVVKFKKGVFKYDEESGKIIMQNGSDYVEYIPSSCSQSSGKMKLLTKYRSY